MDGSNAQRKNTSFSGRPRSGREFDFICSGCSEAGSCGRNNQDLLGE
jgi:hypothetical protein